MRFDSFAHSYDLHAAPQRAFAARVAQFIQPRLDEDILELGAGTGALTRCLLARGSADIRATDGSRAMVELGRRSAPGAQWGQWDAFSGPVPAARLQVSSGLLQWAAEPVKVLENWRSSLKAGGRMVHALACEPCLREWRGLVPESPLQWRDEASWLGYFKNAGLRVSRHELWVERFFFPSSLDLLRAMHRSGVTGQPQLGAGRLRRALRNYALRHSSPQGVVSTWAWLAVEARKV